jgi:hypothetical protein
VKHRDLSAGQAAVERVVARVEEMTSERTEQHSQWVRSDDGARMVPRVTTTVHPSLLGQLRASASGSSAGLAHSVPGSRPAANLAPMAVLQDITSECWVWVRVLDRRRADRADMRDLVTRLWFLADRAPTLVEHPWAFELDRDVTRWWGRARTITTWAEPPLRPHVPCPVCSVRALQVRLYPTVATCLECGSVWDAATVDELGVQVRTMLALAEQDAALQVPRPGRGDLPPDDDAHVPEVLRGLVAPPAHLHLDVERDPSAA